MPISKLTLSLAAEYAVASELCRRGFYTQLTLANLKRTDLLVLAEDGNVARVEVKAKQGKKWPGCKGINGEHSVFLLILRISNSPSVQTFTFSIQETGTVLSRRKKTIPEARWKSRKVTSRFIPRHRRAISIGVRAYSLMTSVSLRTNGKKSKKSSKRHSQQLVWPWEWIEFASSFSLFQSL